MVKLGNFTVEVMQDDLRVKEYNDSENVSEIAHTQPTVTNFIEIKEDCQFTIKIVVHKGFDLAKFDALRYAVTIDGVRKSSGVYGRAKLRINQPTVKTIKGIRRSRGDHQVRHAFRFEETLTRKIKENESLSILREEFRDQGVIVVQLFRVTGNSKPYVNRVSGKDTETIYPKEVVKEKGSTSRAGFDRTSTGIDNASRFIVTSMELPMATFWLKYRTIEALWDQGIVPRPLMERPDSISNALHDSEQLSPEAEIERLRAEVAALKKQIKLENAEETQKALSRKRNTFVTDELGEVELTEERPAHRRKPNSNDVVIELDD